MAIKNSTKIHEAREFCLFTQLICLIFPWAGKIYYENRKRIHKKISIKYFLWLINALLVLHHAQRCASLKLYESVTYQVVIGAMVVWWRTLVVIGVLVNNAGDWWSQHWASVISLPLLCLMLILAGDLRKWYLPIIFNDIQSYYITIWKHTWGLPYWITNGLWRQSVVNTLEALNKKL